MAEKEYSPFFPDPDKGINYTQVGIKPQTSSSTFYNSRDIYDTQDLAESRAYNIGCSGYRLILANSKEYKFAPCSDSKDYRKLMKELPKIPMERHWYEYDPTQNIYDIRDSVNDNVQEGFIYKEQILKRTLSSVIYKDPIKEGILHYFDMVIYGLVESTKQIKNFFNYTVKKNNRRVF
jgi:hypothetical protein